MTYEDTNYSDTINTENMEEFIAHLRDERPSEVNSVNPVTGETETHEIEYMDGTNGEIAAIQIALPEGMSVVLDNGTVGAVKQVQVQL